ncbi:MAG: hypothetical protein AB1792_08400 [Candidatus Zixiibacteriota bacterium]
MTRSQTVLLGALLAATAVGLPFAASDRPPAQRNVPKPTTRSAAPVTANGPRTLSEPAVAAPAVVDTGAQAPISATSANYSIDWHSLNGGGLIDASSTNFKEGMSIGQSVAGEATSPSYHLGIGFWYGTCSCPCQGDPLCDSITNVQYVVLTVNVGFRGVAPVFDPECPRERTDVNCDGVTTVIDVVKMVEVAFRGADPAVEFCHPCEP